MIRLSLTIILFAALLSVGALAGHRQQMCARGWWVDQGSPVFVPCNTLSTERRQIHARQAAPAAKRQRRRYHAVIAPREPQVASWGSSGLVDRARSYLGTNPTGWRSLWCGRFMAMVAPSAAARVRNPALARSWGSLPHTSPHVGAIAVMARRGGGHVGIVSGFDSSGNPIIVSGNNRGAVREGAYPASRVITYVSAE